ncbi:hypothetical protein [Kitasatospora fiedleri]|uniref:hypothetical protein n=1 Tax=Kitasatospora fiedleri TaxID=2991545 RepID=UPI000C2BBE85|nr:hypothetical protein [Kitasatospora fiedleri]
MRHTKIVKIAIGLLAYAALAGLTLFLAGRVPGDSTTGTTIRAAAGGVLAVGAIQFARHVARTLRSDREES